MNWASSSQALNWILAFPADFEATRSPRSRPISGHSNGGRIPPSLQDTATEVPNEFGPGVPKHLRDLLFKVLDGQVPAADSQTAAPAAGAAGAAAGAGAQPEGPAPYFSPGRVSS